MHDCQIQGRRCDSVDHRLAELYFTEGRAKTFNELKAVSTRIQESNASVLVGIRNNKFRFPSTAMEFIALICEFHREIFSVTNLAFAGSLRKDSISFGSGRNQLNGAHPNDIEAGLVEVFNGLPKRQDFIGMSDHAFARAGARFLEEFFLVHPFADGNGRAARIFLIFLAHENQHIRLKPFDEQSSKSKKKYVSSLKYAHRKVLKKRSGDRGEQLSDPYRFLTIWILNLIDSTPISSEEVEPDWLSNIP